MLAAIIYFKYGSLQKFYNDTKAMFEDITRLRNDGLEVTGYEVIK